MNLNKLENKNEAQDLLLSITKSCETLIVQTHWKAEETLEFVMNKQRQIFHFNPALPVEGSWMVGLCDLQAYNSSFNKNHTINKFELYTDNFDGFSLEELKDELGELLNISDITTYHLQHEVIGPRVIEAFTKLRSEKSSTDCYIILLMDYARPPFRDFESYLRTVASLDEDDIQLSLKQYN